MHATSPIAKYPRTCPRKLAEEDFHNKSCCPYYFPHYTNKIGTTMSIFNWILALDTCSIHFQNTTSVGAQLCLWGTQQNYIVSPKSTTTICNQVKTFLFTKSEMSRQYQILFFPTVTSTKKTNCPLSRHPPCPVHLASPVMPLLAVSIHAPQCLLPPYVPSYILPPALPDTSLVMWGAGGEKGKGLRITERCFKTHLN